MARAKPTAGQLLFRIDALDMSLKNSSAYRSQLLKKLHAIDPARAAGLGYRPRLPKSGETCARCSDEAYAERLCKNHLNQMNRRRAMFLNGFVPRFEMPETKRERRRREREEDNVRINRMNRPSVDNRADLMPSEEGYDPREGLRITVVPRVA